MLKDPDQFQAAIDAVFTGMVGDKLSAAERYSGAGEATVREDETLDVTCPRCGRRWSLGMADLERFERELRDGDGEAPPAEG